MKQVRSCRVCKTEFVPRVRTQIYCSHRCANRKNQERLRKRAKLATKLQRQAAIA